jgi:hypothetical protein
MDRFFRVATTARGRGLLVVPVAVRVAVDARIVGSDSVLLVPPIMCCTGGPARAEGRFVLTENRLRRSLWNVAVVFVCSGQW